MAFVLFNLAAVAALVGIDQLIKLWAVQVLQPVGAMPFIPHVVELRFVLNPGMAFSLLSGKQLFLIIAPSAALLAVAYGLFFRSRRPAPAPALPAAGACRGCGKTGHRRPPAAPRLWR